MAPQRTNFVPFYRTLCYCPGCKQYHEDWWNQKERYNKRNDVIRPRVECGPCMEARVGRAAYEAYKRLEQLIVERQQKNG